VIRRVRRLALSLPTLSLLALALAPANALADRKAIEAVAEASGLTRGGEVIASRFDKFIFRGRWGMAVNTVSSTWRWASVTKQVIATLILQEVAAGRIRLDSPVATYLPGFASPNARLVTVRQLLRHQSGLPNPDDTAAAPGAIPAYDAPGYRGSRDPLTGYCAGPVKAAPGGQWSYNNCDYLVLGALLEKVTGMNWPRLVRDRIAGPYGLASVGAFPTPRPVVTGTIDGRPDTGYDLAAFGSAAGLYGTARDLWRFDRALMTGKLMPEAARAEMWDGRPEQGSMALGQWVYTAPLKGCPHPVRIVERRGAIGGVEVRNFILPEWDAVVIAFTDHSGVDFGEVWQGRGTSHDLLAAAICA
jgi:D-alanyl-D-alanine carboxypeptidase